MEIRAEPFTWVELNQWLELYSYCWRLSGILCTREMALEAWGRSHSKRLHPQWAEGYWMHDTEYDIKVKGVPMPQTWSQPLT